jgi:hypothetical protein
MNILKRTMPKIEWSGLPEPTLINKSNTMTKMIAEKAPNFNHFIWILIQSHPPNIISTLALAVLLAKKNYQKRELEILGATPKLLL